MPVPVRLTAVGLTPPLTWSTRFALNGPVALGVKVTLMVHWLPGPRVVPQSLVCAKSTAPLFIIPIPERLTAFDVVLVAMIVLGGLVVFTFWVPNEGNTQLGDNTTLLPTLRLNWSVASVASGAARGMVPVAVSVPTGGGTSLTIME